jgi:membrane protease YdiL (CAAX protease family)
MNELFPTAPRPVWFWRIVQFPLTRLVLMGAVFVLLIGLSNSFREALSSHPWLALAAAAGMASLGLAIYVVFVRFIERRRATELSLAGAGREWGSGVLVGAVLYTLSVLILMIPGIYRIEGLNPWSYLLPAAAMAVSSSVLEEILYRGLLFRIVEESLGSWIAVVVSSLVFGISHLVNPQATIIGALAISVEAGLLLAAAYLVTRRLWLGIGLHLAWNDTQSAIFSGAVSGGNADPGLIQPKIEGPEALTGGIFGLESSLIAFLLCTIAGVILLVKAVRRGNLVAPFWKRKG